MKTNINIKKIVSLTIMGVYSFTTLFPSTALAGNSDKLVYPLKEISKLECRFTEFGELNSNCKQSLPVLKTKDYEKYANQNGGYNDFTRLYTVLWGSSYTYGWDVGNGGHLGVDIATAKGTPVYSMADGKVIKASFVSEYGNLVSLEHTINGKKIVSNYAHLSLINVSVGEKISAGEKIGEVGSTGNSTGNHLHFQIDIDTTYSPIYYDYNSCPYSYYKITEEGVCFNQLGDITVDPLLFLETNGAILSKVTTKTNSSSTTKTVVTNNSNSNNNLSIFDKTVYVGYSKGDIREVQQIYKSLGYYDGKITSDYNDVLESVINYQIDKGVISSKNETGAGRFGPKTRTQTKKDYEKFLSEGGEETKVYITTNTSTVSTIETKTINRKNLLTREEIEAKEVNSFIKDYNVELNFLNPGSNVEVGKTETLKLNVTDSKGKAFKGNMPGDMTFIFNSENINVFPTRLYYFTDGKRDIKVTGLKEGNTTLYVKIGDITVKTFNIKIYNGTKTIYPSDAVIIGAKSSNMGSINTAIGVFKDSNNKNLINLEFGSTYKLVASEGNSVCIKSGTLSNLKKVYTKTCDENDFIQEQDFVYDDTIAGLLIFDFKTSNKNANFKIVNTYDNKTLATKSLKVNEPKGLVNTYEYKDEVLEMLEKGVTTGVNKGYFLQDRNLTEKDAYVWIKNSLENLKEETLDNNAKNKIQNNINDLDNNISKASKYNEVSRIQFLAMTYKYMVFDQNTNITINYKDLDESENKLANAVFSTNNTWKDNFGQSYFQPENNITRGEGAYLLSKIFYNYNNNYLTLK